MDIWAALAFFIITTATINTVLDVRKYIFHFWINVYEWNCWLYGKVMFNIIRNCQNLFSRVAELFLHSHKQWVCILITSSPHQYSIVSLLIVVLLLFVFIVLSCSNRYVQFSSASVIPLSATPWIGM